jgi:hypothetical protein
MTRVEVSWLLSSVILSVYSRLYEQSGPVYVGGIGYILIHLIFLVAMFFFIKKDHDQKSPRSWIFILGVFPILFTQPLFENDHFRYIWEGMSWNYDLNPYQVAAAKVESSIEPILRSKVAYPKLTTVYPFLSQLYFRLFSFLPWEYALKTMQLFNGVLVWLCFKRFWKKKYSSLWVLTFFFWQKEFIQSVHVDLLCALVLFVSLSYGQKLLGILIGSFFKLLPLLFLPFVLITNFRKKGFFRKFIVFDFIFLLGVGLQFYLLGGVEFLSGIKTFSNHWIWNPGMYSILIKLFPSQYEQMRIVTFSLWIIFLFGVYVFCWKKKAYKELPWVYCLLAFSSMMFFSPVYNAWYSVWFIIPALVLGNSWGVVYALMGCWSYLYHGHPEIVWLSELCSHILIFPTIYFIIREINQRVELHEDPPSTQNFAQKT